MCVVCHNEDFKRYDNETYETVQEHRLNYIHLNSGKIIVFCDSCLYDLREKIRK